jgi:nucleotide-binding universal stress UspA family protein
MKSWTPIVVGIDFFNSFHAALREAVRLAHYNQNDVTLAVLGTRGHTGIRSFLMGSPIHECPYSLLAVKPDDFYYPL